MALRWTLGGFGTPFFGADEQVRVDGTDLVRQQGSEVAPAPITSLDAAADFVLDGPPDLEWAQTFDVPAAGDAGAELPVDAEAARFLGDVVRVRVVGARGAAGRSRVGRGQPGAAVARALRRRVRLPADCRGTFGGSPGDAAIAEPYLYVTSSSVGVVRGELWNASGFQGAALHLSDLVAAADQRAAALEFFRSPAATPWRCTDASAVPRARRPRRSRRRLRRPAHR